MTYHLNIFQPEYIHLFESVLAQSRPHLYCQLWMPGGPANLARDEYSLPGLSSAPSAAPAAAPP
eukprot:3307578-Prymnesium_polylepis.1